MSREPREIDPVIVRLTLAALAEEYGARIAGATLDSERGAYLEAWARTSRRELEGLDTTEAASMRALFDAIVERVRS